MHAVKFRYPIWKLPEWNSFFRDKSFTWIAWALRRVTAGCYTAAIPARTACDQVDDV